LKNQSSLEVILRVNFMSFCFDIEPLFNYWIATSLRSSQKHFILSLSNCGFDKSNSYNNTNCVIAALRSQ